MQLTVIGLVPHTAYELKLNVRYARLGLRKWTDGLSVLATTKKADAEAQRLALDSGRMLAGNNAEDMSLLRRLVPVPLDAGKLESRGYKKESPRILPRAESPRMLDSPQKLPRIGADSGVTTENALSNLDPSVPHGNMDEWMDAAQADAHRVTGGMAVTGGDIVSGVAPTVAPGNAEFPSRTADFVPFWRRDPMDGRPTMPPMPTAGHSAMQLDLVPRAPPIASVGASGVLVPRPPNSENISGGRVHRPVDVERTAYPRRYIHE